MIAAERPLQRPRDAKLLVIDSNGRIARAPRAGFLDYLRAGDVVVANDAATLPASLPGIHGPSGASIEVRLAGRASLRPEEVATFRAVVFGAGDFRVRTEDRPLPPALSPGDHLVFGSAGAAGDDLLTARVQALLEHPRFVELGFDGSSRDIWAGLSRVGRPIQYAYLLTPLALWDVWTSIAATPVAFEPPSASFVLDWASVHAMRQRNIGFATITLAAGISSTGDPDLDRRLPFDEPYRIPEATVSAIRSARAESHRVVAIGTTVVRALEHAGRHGTLEAGEGTADQRIGPTSPLRVVDAIISGTHEPESSHYQLLRAFAGDRVLAEASKLLEAEGYRTHEFGDSVFIEKECRLERVRAAA